VGGTFRVLYHWTPSDLTLAADLFQIPAVLDRALITLTALEVYDSFRNYAERDKQRERADRELYGTPDGNDPGAVAVLAEQYGAHSESAGLREIQGY